MRKIILLAFILFFGTSLMWAQTPPDKMTYQIVVRDVNNELVVNQQVGLRISILRDNPTGPTVFMETHSPITNANALATIVVGTGASVFPITLRDIDWENHDFFLKAELSPANDNNYTVAGTQPLVTVPYAFYAGKSGYADTSDYKNLINRPPDGNTTGDILYWDASDSSWHVLPNGQPGQILTSQNNGLCWVTNPTMVNNVAPTVVTDTVYEITGRTALVQCHIVNPGSTGVIASGVCWSTNSNPSLGNSFTSDGTSIDTFISHPTGLVSGTVYYVRAYATNSVGTSYGTPIKFLTPVDCGTVTDRDGNVYQTIYIGAQCWMKENLRTTHYSNGVAITCAKPSTLSSTLPISANKVYYDYNNDSSDVKTYGRLYSWWAVMNGAGSSSNNPSGIQGICPSGWHVPSNAEWCELENYIEPGIDVNCNSKGFRGSMAKRLSYPAYWNLYQSNSFAPGYCQIDTIGFNDCGFSAVPSGKLDTYYSSGGWSIYNTSSYNNQTTNAYFWTCTLSGNSYSPIFYRSISFDSSGIELETSYSTYGTGTYYYAYSVRCVKN